MQLHLHELLIAHVSHWDAVKPHSLHKDSVNGLQAIN